MLCRKTYSLEQKKKQKNMLSLLILEIRKKEEIRSFSHEI